MAAATGVNVAVQTLAANTADTITLTGKFERVELVHVGAVTDPVYYRLDGTTAVKATAENRALLSGERLTLMGNAVAGTAVISLISNGAAVVVLEGIG